MNYSDQDAPDGTLIAAVLAGETSAFAPLVTRYQGPLLRVANSRLGRLDWAEDAVQETFLCAFKSLHSYDSRYSFRTWLWTILLNQCHRQWQRHSRGQRFQPGTSPVSGDEQARQIASELASDASPVQQFAIKERAERIDALLNELPVDQADALRLRFFGGLKFHEIAEAMQCSLSTAKNRVRWGLTKMAQLLGPEDELTMDRSWENFR